MGRNGIRSFLLNAAWVDMRSKQTLPARLGAAGGDDQLSRRSVTVDGHVRL